MPPKRKRDGGMVSPARGRGQKKSRHNTRQQKPGTKVRDNQPPFQHQESSESVPGSEAAPDLGEFVPANFGNIGKSQGVDSVKLSLFLYLHRTAHMTIVAPC
ncbi:uncharacterized protein LOC125667915 isoform X3 [Ostrea edulis]|uniref:uncharacterized protein LOC125683087 isoform X3 n=1 Tax=Ostrea edulis TaxID=37623 RepID=UPI0024AFEF0E|nr:uncharacterized protein LOC125683087 isoform X3 [Ostrea edulis]XP_056020522.1 uncharacterized protein LOC125667915 isoform X3 [Ostrea edulis]